MKDRTFKAVVVGTSLLCVGLYISVTISAQVGQTSHVDAYANESSPVEQKINGKVARVRNVVKMLLADISEEKQTPELLSTAFSLAYNIVSDSESGTIGATTQREYVPSSGSAFGSNWTVLANPPADIHAWGGDLGVVYREDDSTPRGIEIDAGTLVATSDAIGETLPILHVDTSLDFIEFTAGDGSGVRWISAPAEAAPAYCAIYRIVDPRAPGGVTYQPLIGDTLQRISDQLEHYEVAPENLFGVWELKTNAKVALEATDAPAQTQKTVKKWHKKGTL